MKCILCGKRISLWSAYEEEDKDYCKECWKRKIEKEKKEEKMNKKDAVSWKFLRLTKGKIILFLLLLLPSVLSFSLGGYGSSPQWIITITIWTLILPFFIFAGMCGAQF